MLLSSLNKVFSWVKAVAVFANASGTLVLLALVIIMNVDVISRNFFHAPFRGVHEIVIFALVLIVFLQLPDVVRTGRLTRSDGFLEILRSNKSKAYLPLDRIINAVSGIFMCMIVYTVWPEFTEAFESCSFFTQPEFGPAPTGDLLTDFNDALNRCDYFGTPGILTAPWWPVRLAIVFGCAMAAILFLFQAIFGNDRDRTLSEDEA